ncbi:F0F1 ATP synthase subunit epsilon [Telmatospirillum sp. J64-1]|uniref:F0F1 ATP synthase subunit epsilon n=1 Tax=Telmatospirillum sp. J64-1 TaxID=2502183 RepID=UPI00115F1AAE|nr:F0F1 ATP synthase subunit epsilon [Telmatospirillum sp. J64-1]
MAETLQFELVSPEKLLVSEPAEMVTVPGSEGDFGALPRHSPMIATLRPGIIDIYEGGNIRNRIFVAGGFAEVNEERCTVLAEEAVPVSELKAEDAAARLKAAEEALQAAETDQARAQAKRAHDVAVAMQAALSGGQPAAH